MKKLILTTKLSFGIRLTQATLFRFVAVMVLIIAVGSSPKVKAATALTPPPIPPQGPDGSPVVTSYTIVPATIGQPFKYVGQATHSPKDWSANGLPNGLTLSTGVNVTVPFYDPWAGKMDGALDAVITGTVSGSPRTVVVTLNPRNDAGIGSANLIIVIGDKTKGSYYTTYQDSNGVWWFKDPHGNKMLCKAMDACGMMAYYSNYTGDTYFQFGPQLKRFGTGQGFEQFEAQQLTSFGFNTIGAWSNVLGGPVDTSSDDLAWTPVLEIGVGASGGSPLNSPGGNPFPDVFSPDWVSKVNSSVQSNCAQMSSCPWLLGYYIDNELYWGYEWDFNSGNNGDYNVQTQLLLRYLAAPKSKGYSVAMDLLQSKYHGDIQALNTAWNCKYTSWSKIGVDPYTCPPNTRPAIACYNDCSTFAGMVAQKYFSAIHDALKATDPNHLNLGCRFASQSHPLPAIVAVQAKYTDVISFNCYGTDPVSDVKFYDSVAGKSMPMMTGEFSFCSTKDNNSSANRTESAIDEPNQAARAPAYDTYVKNGMATKNLVGYSWFDLFDWHNDADYGVLDCTGTAYPALSKQMKITNDQAESVHASAK